MIDFGKLAVDAVHGDAMHDIVIDKPKREWGNPVVVASVSSEDDHPPLNNPLASERFARELVRRWNAFEGPRTPTDDAEAVTVEWLESIGWSADNYWPCLSSPLGTTIVWRGAGVWVGEIPLCLVTTRGQMRVLLVALGKS